MKESVLNALVQLFALVTDAQDDEGTSLARKQVKAFLEPKISTSLLEEFLDQFEDYFKAFHKPAESGSEKKARKKSSLGSVKVIMLCEEINEQLSRSEKITVLIRLTEFVHKGGQISFRETGFLETLSSVFNIDHTVYSVIQHFVTNDKEFHEDILYIGNAPGAKRSILHDQTEHFAAVLILEESGNAFLKNAGVNGLTLDNLKLKTGDIHAFESGSHLSSRSGLSVYHSDAMRTFFEPRFEQNIYFEARDISYTFPNGTAGLHRANIAVHSGELAGIMGASGAGKSTLLNVLNGNFRPTTGSVTFNGIDAGQKEAKQLIGYVPQDDLLIEELTVFENLYFNGRLCLPELSKSQLRERIETVLEQIDLHEISHLRVGSPLDKVISGGQRKRLNIALELLREPSVLFVDEPTSGLSSQDSEMVMNLLKRLTYKGQLIFCVIHQPSSHIYKLLDRLLLLDKGGYLIFNNHPMEAPGWFRKRAGFVESPTTIGKGVAVVDPDEMLRIVEARQVDEFGRTTNERVRTPKEWYEAFLAQVKPIENQTGQTSVYTPPRPYLTPSWATQFGIYFKRNLLSKIRNRAYLAIALLEAPVLASIIGYFTRYAAGNEDNPFAYFLYFNKNLPAYLFMIIVVAIFIGMQISAEEIIRDRKILRRESFLNLKRSAYINSKVLYFLFLSAIQAGLLTLAGNLWLQIDGLYMLFFTVLFSTFVFANLLGLNISASLKSVVTIYILVPFLVVPQLLLSGVIVDFDTLQSADKQGGPTPIIADIMVSRWAYEALAVGHFTQNKYMKHFFDAEREKQEALYQFSLRIPKLQTINQQSTALIGRNDASRELSEKLNLLNHEVQKINSEMNPRFEHNESLRVDSYNQLTADLLDAWLREMERQYRKIWEKADDVLRQREDLLVSEENSITDISEWKNRHHNEKLEEHVRNKHELQKLRVVDGKLIRKTDYIYLMPESHFGRAHFYAPVKKTGGFIFSTHWFNVAVIWLMNVLLYLILLNNRGGSFLKKPAVFKRS